jgi:hypothetical protein
VIEDMRFCRDHLFGGAILAQKIRREDFYGGIRTTVADGMNDGGEMTGTAVIKVVAIDLGDYHVGKTHARHRIGDLARFVVV